MTWWGNALYDTCSLITLDKLFQIDGKLDAHFTSVLALEVSFHEDQMREESATRLKDRATIQALPEPGALASILSAARLSKALADVDRLVYAASVHSGVAVVTGDKRLAKALKKQRATAGNMALIMKELVLTRKLSRKRCGELLRALTEFDEFLLGSSPPTWVTLQNYTFP